MTLKPIASDISKDCLSSDISGSSQATCVSPVLTVFVSCNLCLQARIAADLIELRNKSVFAFFMFNALFVLIVFLLQLNKDMLHVDWPLGVKTNITYIEETAEVKTRQWVTTSVQSSTNGYRLFWSGVTESGLVKSGLVWSLLIKPGIIWLNLMWYSKRGLVWSGLVWSYLWSALINPGVIWLKLILDAQVFLVWKRAISKQIWLYQVWFGTV